MDPSIIIAALQLIESLGPEVVKAVNAWQASGKTVADFKASLAGSDALEAQVDEILGPADETK